MVQASSTTPSGRITLSGKPSCTVVSTTTAGLNSFMTPSTSRKSAGSPLMTSPVQRFAFDMAAHPAPSGRVRLVQKRQLGLAARDRCRRLADEPFHRSREVRLVEVAGVVRGIGDRRTRLQQLRDVSRANDLQMRAAR